MKNWGAINRSRRKNGRAQALVEAEAKADTAATGPTAIRLNNCVGTRFDDVTIDGFETGISMSGGDLSARGLGLRNNRRSIVVRNAQVDIEDSGIE